MYGAVFSICDDDDDDGRNVICKLSPENAEKINDNRNLVTLNVCTRSLINALPGDRDWLNFFGPGKSIRLVLLILEYSMYIYVTVGSLEQRLVHPLLYNYFLYLTQMFNKKRKIKRSANYPLLDLSKMATNIYTSLYAFK